MTIDKICADLATVRLLADKWRNEQSKPRSVGSIDCPYWTLGYVIVYYGTACGWTRELTEPHKWCPDCIAVPVSPLEPCFIAVGGDDHAGARQFDEIRRKDGAS